MSFPSIAPRHHAVSAPRLPLWFWGGLLAAIADLSLAAGYWFVYDDVAPIRIPQSIASWLLGPAARAEGMASAVLGFVLYVGVLCALMAAYQALARRLPALHRHPLACGATYGVAAYLLIFHLFVPYFSAAVTTGPSPWHWTLTCMLAYVGLVGIPAALLARAARR
ncbi:MAG: hypothetical protein QM761_00205 [Pseudoxanthomonas sp.]